MTTECDGIASGGLAVVADGNALKTARLGEISHRDGALHGGPGVTANGDTRVAVRLRTIADPDGREARRHSLRTHGDRCVSGGRGRAEQVAGVVHVKKPDRSPNLPHGDRIMVIDAISHVDQATVEFVGIRGRIEYEVVANRMSEGHDPFLVDDRIGTQRDAVFALGACVVANCHRAIAGGVSTCTSGE